MTTTSAEPLPLNFKIPVYLSNGESVDFEFKLSDDDARKVTQHGWHPDLREDKFLVLTRDAIWQTLRMEEEGNL